MDDGEGEVAVVGLPEGEGAEEGAVAGGGAGADEEGVGEES